MPISLRLRRPISGGFRFSKKGSITTRLMSNHESFEEAFDQVKKVFEQIVDQGAIEICEVTIRGADGKLSMTGTIVVRTEDLRAQVETILVGITILLEHAVEESPRSSAEIVVGYRSEISDGRPDIVGAISRATRRVLFRST